MSNAILTTLSYTFIQSGSAYLIANYLEKDFNIKKKAYNILVALFVGILFFLTYYQITNLNLSTILLLFSNILFLTSVFTDINSYSVYIIISYAFIGINIILSLLKDPFSLFLLNIGYGLFIYLVFFLINIIGKKIYKKEALGDGDLDILYGLIFQLSIQKTIYIFVSSSYLVSIYAIILKFVLKKNIKTIHIPLLPFLFTSYTLNLYF